MKKINFNNAIYQKFVKAIYLKALDSVYSHPSEGKRHIYIECHRKLNNLINELRHLHPDNLFYWEAGVLSYNTFVFTYGAAIDVYDNGEIIHRYIMYISPTKAVYFQVY